MFIKSLATLVYEGQGVATNGSPTKLINEVTNVRVDEMETFSNNYYDEQQRNMRKSRNLVVPTYLTQDITISNVVYELMYVNYEGSKYKVKKILKYKGTRQKMILDIEEVR